MRSFRWLTWRRDLVVGLIGAVLCAAVLVPVGWLRIQDERRQAEETRGKLEAREAEIREAHELVMRRRDQSLRALAQLQADHAKKMEGRDKE